MINTTKAVVIAVIALLLAGAGCGGVAAPADASDPLEEFMGVYRACTMLSHADTAGNWVFPGVLVLQEFSQVDQDAIRQVFGFSGLTPTGERAAIGSFCRFKRLESIINFIPNQDVETAFRSFLSEDRATENQLNDQLNWILRTRQADPQGPVGTRFETVFATPHQAVSAAIQPWLASLTPRVREGIWFSIMGGFMDAYAADPEQYQSQDAIVNIFEDYREGFVAGQ